jgi:hypothetical protein
MYPPLKLSRQLQEFYSSKQWHIGDDLPAPPFHRGSDKAWLQRSIALVAQTRPPPDGYQSGPFPSSETYDWFTNLEKFF